MSNQNQKLTRNAAVEQVARRIFLGELTRQDSPEFFTWESLPKQSQETYRTQAVRDLEQFSTWTAE